MANKRCEGKRRMWRGNKLGNFKCGRVAKITFQTYVGTTKSHFACNDPECVGSLTNGYGANNVRELAK